MNNNTINLLIATMEKENFSFLDDINIQSPAVVINQNSGNNSKKNIEVNDFPVTIISNDEKGLSKSRNLALKNSDRDISVITDDDMTYDKNYPELIQKAYNDYPDADVIAFQVERHGNPAKNKTFPTNARKLNYLTSMKISSVEITFKTESIKRNNIKFNETIGAGTEFPNGEENQFLYDCLRNGLKLYYVPIEIGSVDMSDSTWFKGYNDQYLEATGVKFYNMTKRYYDFLIWQYLLRKRKEFSDRYSISEARKVIYNGIRKYRDKYENKTSN